MKLTQVSTARARADMLADDFAHKHANEYMMAVRANRLIEHQRECRYCRTA